MAKLGSKKNPLILGLEPGEEEDLSDLERKLNPPVRNEVVKIGRNDPCICGSGKKFKKYCGAYE